MVLLKTILIILLVYYGLKIVAKWYGPRLFKYAAKKTEERFREKFGEFTEQRSDEEQIGDVTIKKNKPKTTSSKETVGEYIEFEELD